MHIPNHSKTRRVSIARHFLPRMSGMTLLALIISCSGIRTSLLGQDPPPESAPAAAPAESAPEAQAQPPATTPPATTAPATTAPATTAPATTAPATTAPATAEPSEPVAQAVPAVEPKNDSGAAPAKSIVDFQKDIAPILANRCLECHGPKQAKNDFRVDVSESVLELVVAKDPASSSLLTDYLLSTDVEMLMPPSSHGGPLAANELATIRLWIEEGAAWPSGASVAKDGAGEGSTDRQPAKPEEPQSLAGRIWAFQGYFHPAVVHFPIALLIVGGLFAFLSYVPGFTSADTTARTCLVLGALGAVLACTMGWSFATERGYGDWTRTDGEIFWHRLSGIVVAVFSTALIPLALFTSRESSSRHWWRLGLIAAAAMVGLVGHQGGELTYGEEMYHRAFEKLLGPQAKEAAKPANPQEKSATEEKSASRRAVPSDFLLRPVRSDVSTVEQVRAAFSSVSAKPRGRLLELVA